MNNIGGNIKESVFDGVMRELPIDATNVSIYVSWSFKLGDGTHKGSVDQFYPSKAGATFNRAVQKTDDAFKRLGSEIEKALGEIRGLEERTHKRLNKLERKNDSDPA